MYKTGQYRGAAGSVYFALSGNRKLVKIGFSTNPNRRINELTVSHPGIRIIAHLPGTTTTESDMHQRFAHFRIKGEWFAYHAELRRFVNKLKLTPMNPLPIIVDSLRQTSLRLPLPILRAAKHRALALRIPVNEVIVQALAKQLGVTL